MRIPPGRAGRLWLRDRLATAERGAATLERKVRVLRRERDRFAERERATEAVCRDRLAVADELLLRAALLAGQDGLRAAERAARAEVTVRWTSTMGVRHPDAADCALPAWPTPEVGVVGPAVARARVAWAEAVVALLAHAVAREATRRIDAEVAVTRLRVRALRRHWLPELRAALARVELELEELERAEGVRRRCVRSGTEDPARRAPGPYPVAASDS